MEKFLQKSKLSRFIRNANSYTQSTFTCSKSTIETLEEGMKYAQSKQ